MQELTDERVLKCLLDDDGASITLVRLIVKPEWRSKGVGGAMLEQVKDIARFRRRMVRLIVQPDDDTDRTRLVRFYKRHGFQLLRDNETMIYHP